MLHGRRARPLDVSRAIDAGSAYVNRGPQAIGSARRRCPQEHTLANLLSFVFSYSFAVAAAAVHRRYKELKGRALFGDRMQIRSSDVYQPCGSLSGVHQQKVVCRNGCLPHPEILILDDDPGITLAPNTRSIESSTAGRWPERPSSCISSEMPELLGICDRIAS